ncbi:hypothetical protein [Desulfoplanes formicivorans]|uniref:Uncharacterized protein n=1 Tax=Desulfoplanes formicivorans TaxID=1592317 RepID=A0A194AGJ1_9BACT|nr:hypothetical protein [Desulfoplanes formicivorans]GAU09192.1 hypothetical protein DPF_1913 [Desulfoplanes formicivorans]
MNLSLHLLVAALLMMVLTASAQAIMHYPPIMEGKIAQYPGSEIVQTTSVEVSSQVILQTNDSMDKVTAFYKRELLNNGLKTEIETSHAKGWNVFFSHNEAGGMIGVTQQKPGKIIITIVYSLQ